MPKKIFAVTNLKVGTGEGEYFEAGSVVDRSKFTDAQLLELHEAGAIEVRVVDEELAPDGTPVTAVVETMETPETTETTESTEEVPPPDGE